LQARTQFMRGVACEKRGDMHDAIRHYHSAVHMVPDIEQQVFRRQNDANASRASTQVHDVTMLSADGSDQLDTTNSGRRRGLSLPLISLKN
jgi:hypothetical protein